MDVMDNESSNNYVSDGNPTSSKDPTEFLKMKPKKSILKSKQTSLDDLHKTIGEERATSEESQKGAHFDEMSILATYHPPNKDYGHMKIDEPKTPYNAFSDSEEDNSMSTSSDKRARRVSLVGPVDADELHKGLSNAVASEKPKCFEPGSGPDDEEDESCLTKEEIEHKREFERKRRAHYDEGVMLRKMREKMATAATESKDEDEE